MGHAAHDLFCADAVGVVGVGRGLAAGGDGLPRNSAAEGQIVMLHRLRRNQPLACAVDGVVATENSLSCGGVAPAR